MKMQSARRNRLAPLALGLLALAMLAAGPAMADIHFDELGSVERQLEADRDRAAKAERQQRAAAAGLAELRREAIAAAKRAQEHESRLIELDDTLYVLGRREDEARAALRARQRELAAMLGAMERLSRNPPQTMFAFPDAPMRMVRSAMLLRAALPRLREDSRNLRAELDELAGIQAEARLQLASLETETKALEAERGRLAAVMRRKSALLKRTKSETREINRRVRELADRAESIRELLAQIEAERLRREAEELKRQEEEARAQRERPKARPKPRPQPNVALARPPGVRPFPGRGTITPPTSAPILRRYGERNAQGAAERGITYKTRPWAQIVAPHDGKVVFAGPFEGYGQILIIEHDGGYHTLLAGMERLDIATGEWVLAGEPVGAMGPRTTGASGEELGLYLELRRAGQPINPRRWVAQR